MRPKATTTARTALTREHGVGVVFDAQTQLGRCRASPATVWWRYRGPAARQGR